MATDIHLFVEYRSRASGEYVSLTEGEFNLPAALDLLDGEGRVVFWFDN